MSQPTLTKIFHKAAERILTNAAMLRDDRNRMYYAIHALARYADANPFGIRFQLSEDRTAIQIAKAPLTRKPQQIVLGMNNSFADKDEMVKNGLVPISYQTLQYYPKGSPKAEGNPDYIAWRTYTPARAIKALWALCIPEEKRGYVRWSRSRNYCFDAIEEGARDAGYSPKDPFFETLASAIGTLWPFISGQQLDYDIDIVDKEAITDVYSDKSGQAGSCMIGKRQTRFYRDNPPGEFDWDDLSDPDSALSNNPDPDLDGVAMLRASYEGEMVGRALLWSARLVDRNTDEFIRRVAFLDRCYPSDKGPQSLVMRRYALSRNWLFKRLDSYEYHHIVDGGMVPDDADVFGINKEDDAILPKDVELRVAALSNENGWPYLDTLHYVRTEHDGYLDGGEPVELSNRNPKRVGYRSARSTDGNIGEWQEPLICSICGEDGHRARSESVWNVEHARVERVRLCPTVRDRDYVYGIYNSPVDAYSDSAYLPRTVAVEHDGTWGLPEAFVTTLPNGAVLPRSSTVRLSEEFYGPDAYAAIGDSNAIRWNNSTQAILSEHKEVVTLPYRITRRFGILPNDPWKSDHAPQRVWVYGPRKDEIFAARDEWLAENPPPEPTVTQGKDDQFKWSF